MIGACTRTSLTGLMQVNLHLIRLIVLRTGIVRAICSRLTLDILNLHNPRNDLPFMCEKMVINRVEKLVPNLYDKKNYIIHIRASD